MSEWLPLGRVPELAAIIQRRTRSVPPPKPSATPAAPQATTDLTGGFLGTGMLVGGESVQANLEPTPRPKSIPPPLPTAKQNGSAHAYEADDVGIVALSGRLASAGRRPLGSGDFAPPSSSELVHDDELFEAPPQAVRQPQIAQPAASEPDDEPPPSSSYHVQVGDLEYASDTAAARPPPPVRDSKKVSGAAPNGRAPRMPSMPTAPKPPKKFTAALPPEEPRAVPEEDAPPSSRGTPELRALTSKTSGTPRRDSDRPPLDFSFGGGGDLSSMLPKGLASPRLPDIETPTDDDEPASDSVKDASTAPVSVDRQRKGKPRSRKSVQTVPAVATAAAKKAAPQKSGAGGVVLGSVLIGALLAGAFLLLRKPSPEAEPATPAYPEAPAAAVAAPAEAPPANTAAATEAAAAIAPQPAAPAPAAAPAAPHAKPADKPADKPQAPADKPAASQPAATPAAGQPAAAAAPTAPAAGQPAAAAPAAAAPAAAPAEGAAGPAFDRDAALAALSTASAEAANCRKEGEPTGSASVVITFAPSGRVTSALVQGPPFAGTATGGCIAAAMRKATVPAFDGPFVRVTKTVKIQ
jgi:hypothetical protein